MQQWKATDHVQRDTQEDLGHLYEVEELEEQENKTKIYYLYEGRFGVNNSKLVQKKIKQNSSNGANIIYRF